MTMTPPRHFLIATSLALALCANCAAQPSEPEENFEHLWQTFDRNYALFGAKRVDWDALYAVYRPRITPQTTDDELFEVMASLVGHLNDNHVRLISPERRFQSGILGEMEMEDFSLEVVKEKYLRNEFETRVRDYFTYGWLRPPGAAEGGDRRAAIGYFHFRGFGLLAASTAATDEIIAKFQDAAGIVVDVRANGGGDDRVGKAIADRFADRRRLYMTTATRNGPEHDDFAAPKYWYVEPQGERQFTRPVILLTHRFSVSAAENFALAMRVLPHVTVVGDATSGVFADVYRDTLPNDWHFGVPYKLFLDHQGFCWEGIGVPADLRQTNSKEDVEAGRDKVIELAMALIDSGALGRQKEGAGLVDLRASLVAELAGWLERDGPQQAAATFRERQASDPDAYYVDQDELRELWQELHAEEDQEAALAVATLRVEQFPSSYAAHRDLGESLVAKGNGDRARASFETARRLNRASYPWEKQDLEEIESLLAGRRVLSTILRAALRRQALDQALAEYRREPGRFYVNENVINRLGYELLGSDQVAAAIAVFQLNVEAFPDSFNVYDSLGEAYMAHGDRELAIKNYERSIELNPENTNGIRMLERLRTELEAN